MNPYGDESTCPARNRGDHDDAGAVLMFLAPEVWQSALLLAAGVALEPIGIALEHRAK